MKICAGAELSLLGQDLLLLPEKAIYWKQEKALIAADVHLGKSGHFRKAGIAIPQGIAQEDLAVLSDLIAQYQPEKLIFLGDLFHSDKNTDWDWFVLWREQFPNLEIILVIGNHDIIKDHHYHQLNIQTPKEYLLGPFLMLHHPQSHDSLEAANGYVLCGHIHPGVRLSGKGRQSITLPCFTFGKRQGILPSFGKFTGRVAIRHQDNDQVFGVLNNKVIAV
ncbi:ligase-associated DNA damage response endonuclease PdeM [Mucilaginibacter sp. KACC 22063]|uniref:ligase-associated DNA damage response endonuclease PdeM n=1 Tax=Mucilaginibacter sp. KACC 22063 TaxID=3025666 RepID=UPI002365873A|nr:ligase-associated DNA damage response endonuclease PdeM [Mucilaginibacter sp. KACC 22063]WDF55485.1 ligase-associated DNA damage response endonuclease PdeM [Mucilaginibacter sp. KACC 22063]